MIQRPRASSLAARLAMVISLFLLAACTGICAGPTAAAAPLVGYWSWEGDGVQQVTSVGSGSFDGTVVQAASIGACAAPKGRLVLKLSGSGRHYTGQDEWFRDSDCARKFSSDAVLDLTQGDQTAHLCSTGPFTDVAPVHSCVDLKRITNFKPK